MKLLKFCLGILLLLPVITGLKAQSGVTSAGGIATGSNGSISYSVGQAVYTTFTGTNGSLSQGIQQPYEISAAASVDEIKGINLLYSAYPNPATNFLILKIESQNLSEYQLYLYDTDGKLIENKRIENNETSINMQNLVPTTYLLKITLANKTVKTFKIVKN